MLPEGSIEASHLWKRFRADAKRWSVKTQARYLAAHARGDTGDFWRWALRDVDVHVEPGEAVGLVGPNGSGKSTLLKLLTRVMRPYAGSLEVSGRVGALIQVRAGITDELTGRENVYLYGSILGLRRAQVARRFDEIVAFGELEEAIDRQVKFYSSGMQMRLGFAVVAFLEPAILLVDEVLAVGDAAFQQRCLDRMREVVAEGTTLVLVSHDLAAVESICTRCVFLRNGTVQSDGPIHDVLTEYRAWIETLAETLEGATGIVQLLKARVQDASGGSPRSGEPVEVQLVLDSQTAREASIFIGVSEGPATAIFVLQHNTHLVGGEQTLRCLIRSLPLPKGSFYLWVGVSAGDRTNSLLPWHPAARFDVIGLRLKQAPTGVVLLSPVFVQADWDLRGA